jgi:hypothetical protein
MVLSAGAKVYGPDVRFQETLRRLAMIDEGFVEDEAGLRLGPAAASALDPKTAALLQVGISVAIGSSAVCLEWSTGIADVLLAVGPGGRVRPGRRRRTRCGDCARV